MVKIFTTLRNNWKKSTFALAAFSYGTNWSVNQYQIELTMRSFCDEAVKFGDVPVGIGKHRRVTVILNPSANKRKAKKNFEKYCAPLLHLSGIYVTVVETEREGHAKNIINKIDPLSDAIVVAGGDGTLSEALTGLMREKGELCQVPIGVLPLGKTNTLAGKLFEVKEDKTSVHQMAEATLAVVRGNTKPLDAIRIEPIDSQDQRPIYSMSGIEWGMWHDVRKKQEKFWYFGPLKGYASLIFPGNAVDKKLAATVRYTPPCSGCSNCYNQRPDLLPHQATSTNNPLSQRWWARLTLAKKKTGNSESQLKTDYSKIINEHCTEKKEKDYTTADILVMTSRIFNKLSDAQPPRIVLSVGPRERNQAQVLYDGLKYFKGKMEPIETIEAKQIEIVPKAPNKKSDKETTPDNSLSIDNEDYEVRPIRVTVLPNSVNFFY